MTAARCPLVREIEEVIAMNGPSHEGATLREYWRRIRAALEAAHDMHNVLDYLRVHVAAPFPPDAPIVDVLDAYRAATRKP